jgi:hypothetical protein
MTRYCDIPVEKMTNLDKIKSICERISRMGGVHIYPVFGTFTMASENVSYVGDSMYLYDITSTKLVFCEIDKERSETTDPFDGREKKPNLSKMWNMPLNWFSESFLYNVLVTLKKECREHLTENAYKEVLFEIGEL